MNGSVLEEKSFFNKMLELAFVFQSGLGYFTLSLLLKLTLWKLDPSFDPWSFSPLEMLDELQKQLCRSVDPSLAASLEPFAHCWNKVSLRFFYRYYFGRSLSELAQLVPLPKSRGRSTRYSDGLHDLYITIPSFFPCTAKLWNFLPIDCFLSHMIYIALILELTGTFYL